MAYDPTHPDGWEDLPSPDTPVMAAHLDHIEAGIQAAAETADSAYGALPIEGTTGNFVAIAGADGSMVDSSSGPEDFRPSDWTPLRFYASEEDLPAVGEEGLLYIIPREA